mmetsp:Transcript_7951/g.18746  ORF Transcript_7951/g.18746 Transcript_7951/m.18746 type:complete len:200 (-) Transcript_7951:53-652(-)
MKIEDGRQMLLVSWAAVGDQTWDDSWVFACQMSMTRRRWRRWRRSTASLRMTRSCCRTTRSSTGCASAQRWSATVSSSAERARCRCRLSSSWGMTMSAMNWRRYSRGGGRSGGGCHSMTCCPSLLRAPARRRTSSCVPSSRLTTTRECACGSTARSSTWKPAASSHASCLTTSLAPRSASTTYRTRGPIAGYKSVVTTC